MPPSCALLCGFAIGSRVALLWQHNANPSYKLASIPRYDDMVRANARRGLRALLAGNWPSTGRDVLNITAAAWTAGFHWWRSGNITRTQNVSEYMLVLALCLVFKRRKVSVRSSVTLGVASSVANDVIMRMAS